MGKGGGSVGTSVRQLEPVKSAEQAVREAQDATTRAQRMRQGISGTFSRATVGGGAGAAPSSATSGTASKLGGI